MASSLFRIVNHTVECQHVREYPRATLSGGDDTLHLAVKQYIPKDNPNPQPGDLTILGAHANGFPKELYEPLWSDVLTRSRVAGLRIRSIWIADVAQQSASGVLNEDLLGNDPSWNDHPRDLLHLINVMKLPRPIIGVGHSMGGHQLTQLALMHPRLLTGLVLIDPVISMWPATPPDSGQPNPAQASTFRRDIWPSREAAAASFAKSPFYKVWDPRVLEAWITHGLREVPTPIHPEADPKSVTLTCPKSQEVFTFLRPNFSKHGVDGNPADLFTHPDINPLQKSLYPFYRPEQPQIFARLPEVRPSVLYIFGSESDVGPPEFIKQKMDLTGVGVGGSGGAKAGRVSEHTFPGIGHLIAMEIPDRTAEKVVPWLVSEVKRWKDGEARLKKEWAALTWDQKRRISPEWEKMIGGPLKRGGGAAAGGKDDKGKSKL